VRAEEMEITDKKKQKILILVSPVSGFWRHLHLLDIKVGARHFLYGFPESYLT